MNFCVDRTVVLADVISSWPLNYVPTEKDYETAFVTNATIEYLQENGKKIWLVLEGDWGGQIYLTIPICFLGEEAKVAELLKFIDERAWSCNDGHGTDVQLNLTNNPENGVSGGMGGGMLLDRLWMYCEFSDSRWKEKVFEMLGLAEDVEMSLGFPPDEFDE